MVIFRPAETCSLVRPNILQSEVNKKLCRQGKNSYWKTNTTGSRTSSSQWEVTGVPVAAINQLLQEPVNRIAKEWITNDNKDHKQIIPILKQNHTTSTPHLTKQCETRQLRWFYSQQPRYRRRTVRSKSRQRNVRRSTNIISNTTIISF
jgi:phosphopentomutase